MLDYGIQSHVSYLTAGNFLHCHSHGLNNLIIVSRVYR